MKKLITLLFCVQLAVSVMAAAWDGTTASAFAGGTGTSTDPYQIATAEQLAYLASLANASPQTANANTAGKYYQLTADIDLGSLAWTPIGTATATAFAGIFDGNNFSINNLLINDATTVYAGLFGYPTGTASSNVIIKNLSIASGSITVTNASSTTGAFAGRAAYAHFYNCKNTINIKGSSQVAGIVGTLGGGVCVVEYCSNSGTITCGGSGLHIGGIVGNSAVVSTAGSATSYIRYCYNTGAVTAISNAGGITGSGSAGILTIKECFNKGVVTASNTAAGGIVGYGYGASFNVLNCYNTGLVKQTNAAYATPYAGGILGYPGGNAAGKYFQAVSNCYNTAAVTGVVKEAIAGALKGGAATTDGTGSVVNSYYLSTLTVTNINGGTSKTAVEMQLPAFISTINNGQSPSVWSMDVNFGNAGFPVLVWELSPVPAYTGLKNIEFKNLNIYAVGKTIQVDLEDVSSYDLSLYTVNGSLINHQKSTQSHLSLDVIKSGFYLVKITDGTHSSVSKVIVK